MQVVEGAAPQGSFVSWEPDEAGIRGHAFGEFIQGEAFTAPEGGGHDTGIFEVPGPCDLRRALDAAAKCTYNACPQRRRWPGTPTLLLPEYGEQYG